MIITTWNVNSIRARHDRLLAWLDRAQPDVVCLQEIKVAEDAFPFEATRKAGYHAAVHGQPTYNGVAILSREEPTDVVCGLGDDVDDPQARLIAATVADVRVFSAYFPNGGAVGSDKWEYKLAWMRRLREYLERHGDPEKPLALCGDFNVAPEDIDAAYPADWADTVLCHPEARAALEAIRDWGLVDTFRLRHAEGGHYSWWDYRNLAFPRDDGLRIDHVFVTEPLVGRCTGAMIDCDERKGEKPSDHTPVGAVFDVEVPEKAAVTPEKKPRAAKKLVIVDGHSVAYRAFYGLPLYDRRGKVTFSTSQGEFTNAVYGFTSMLIKTWNEERPDYLAVAFDLGRTFRDDLFEDYKGTREKMPDELTPQIERIFQLVDAFDIPAITAEGYEADDILGTLAGRAAREGIDVLIVTGDSDAFQLVDERVHVMAPGRLWSDVHVHDEAAIEERYGLAPKQLIDYKALVGDSSDNIPGVRGVGKKTAGPLLQTYGSVESIYDHLEDVVPTRARNALTKGHDMALLSKDLVTIRTDVPIDLDWEDCAVHEYDRDKVEALFDVLEFRTIRNRLPEGGVTAAAPEAGTADGGPAMTSEPVPGEQMAMFGLHEGRSAPAERQSPTETTIVRDEAALASLVEELEAAEIVSFDVETTSTDAMLARLVGIALTTTEGVGYYVPVGHAGAAEQLDGDVVAKALAPLLADPNRPKVAHNAKYDMAVLQLAGFDVAGLTFDTMLAEFLIDPGGRFGLKGLAKTRLGIDMTEITDLIGTGKKQITMDLVPIDDAAPYAAADVDMTLRLMSHQVPRLDELDLRGLLNDVELPLVPVLLDMELAGVLIDTELLGEQSERLARRLIEIEDEVYHLVGAPFNINSPQQLAEVLFERLGLESPRARRTRTGRVSVAADVLDSMRGTHPVIDLVLEHRQITKLKGTYIDALPRLVHPDTGRVHTSFNQTGAVSGRLASQDPNLQNIPIRTDLGREVRRAFVVPDGWSMIAADYSQVELRIVAHICGDPGLRTAFAEGQDIHRATAATVLGVPPDEVTSDQRSFAKRVNFGLLYGMGARSLARQADIPMKEAQAFVDAYFTGFPKIKQFIEDTKQRAREDGYVETILGRRRYFPILEVETRDNRTRVLQSAAEREAVNHPVQGSAADVMKIAMIQVHERLKEGGFRARMLLQVHDEVVLEAPDDEVEAVAALVKETMEGAYTLDPELKVDVGIGQNWLEVK